MARYNARRVMQWQGFLYSPYGPRRSCTPRRRQTPNPSFFQPEGTKPLYVEKRMRSTAHSATLPIAEAFTPGKVFWCATLPPSRDQDELCWKAQRGQKLSWLTSLGEKTTWKASLSAYELWSTFLQVVYTGDSIWEYYWSY